MFDVAVDDTLGPGTSFILGFDCNSPPLTGGVMSGPRLCKDLACNPAGRRERYLST